MTSSLFPQDSLSQILPSVVAGNYPIAQLSEDQLAELCSHLNEAYRRGEPLVTDHVYDRDFVAELRRRNPEHPFLATPEPEPEKAFAGERFKHQIPMLSTDKGYTQADVSAWTNRVRQAARDLGLSPGSIQIRVTPKLDGIAAARYANALVTRGKNGYGNDVGGILTAGVVETAPGALGPGEIVVEQAFFDREISAQFDLDHPRNFIAGLCGADTLKEHHHAALSAGACRFVSYSSLVGLNVSIDDFENNWEALMDQAQKVPYLCDGAVCEVTDDAIKQHMGATSRAHRWQLAVKRNDAEAETTVIDVIITVGRTGRIAPTLSLEPVQLYGVTVRNATAHTARHLEELGLGPGARVRITRGGGVIPRLVGVTKPSEMRVSMDHCPCCNAKAEVEGAYRVCPETATCSAQASAALEHFFKTLATCKGFGPAVTEKLVEKGIKRVDEVYRMDEAAFQRAGISPGVAKNLVAELERSRREPIAPALLVAAMGVRHLGRGDSRHLLEVVPIEGLGEITPEQVAKAEGFGPLTSEPVARGLRKVWPMLSNLIAMGFTFEEPKAIDAQSPVSGLAVVFTGAMQTGSREDMEAHARQLGAKVGGSVTGKTSVLVCGEKVGAAKTQKAQQLGVKTMTEAEWLQMIAGPAM